MRTAYSGRAAARYVMGDYEHAILDYDEAVLRCLELIHENPNGPDTKLECAQEYRKRSLAQRGAYRFKTSRADEEKAKKLEEETIAPTAPAEQRLSQAKFKDEIAKLEQAVQTLQALHDQVNSVRQAGTSGVATGRVWLVNTTAQSQFMYVNGRQYSINPGDEIPVDLPAGTFNYQLFWEGRLLPQTSRQLSPMQCFSLVINPS
jgi:hypothetical protein